jgi:hypothetical protein
MATHFWLGGNSGHEGDFATAANWSSGGVPGDGDTIVFDERAGIATAVTGHTAGKHWNCVDGLDQSTKNFAAILILAGFTGNIGIGYSTPTATESALECAADKIICSGLGSYYLTAKHASALFDLVICDTASGYLYIGKAATDGQKTTLIINVKGTAEFLEAVASHLAAPELDELRNITAAATTYIGIGNTSSVLAILVAKGNVYCDSGFASAEVCGGKLYWGIVGTTHAASITGSAMILNGGNCDWRAYATLSGLKIRQGTLSAIGGQIKILGDSGVNSGTIEVEGGVLDLKTQGGAITIAANCEVVTRGSDAIYYPPKDVNNVW